MQNENKNSVPLLQSNLEQVKIDYTEWQKTLWQDEAIESLSAKAQKAWKK